MGPNDFVFTINGTEEKLEVRGQKSEVRGPAAAGKLRSGVRGQRSEVRGRRQTTDWVFTKTESPASLDRLAKARGLPP
jgi:hypothetical protein